MEIILLIVVAAIVLTVVYFFPIQQNRYGERLYGRKHLERAVNATLKSLWPEKHESKEEVVERKEKSRKFADHIIGVDLLLEEEAVQLFIALFSDLKEIDLGDITISPIDYDIVLSSKNQHIPEFEDACSPTERLRFFMSYLNIPQFGKASFSILSRLTGNLSVFGYNEGDEFHSIPGEPTSEDCKRVEKLRSIENTFENENEEKLIAIRQECDDIIDGRVTGDKEKINTFIAWLEDYDKLHASDRFSKDKEVRTKFLNNTKENKKRLIGLKKKLKTIIH